LYIGKFLRCGDFFVFWFFFFVFILYKGGIFFFFFFLVSCIIWKALSDTRFAHGLQSTIVTKLRGDLGGGQVHNCSAGGLAVTS